MKSHFVPWNSESFLAALGIVLFLVNYDYDDTWVLLGAMDMVMFGLEPWRVQQRGRETRAGDRKREIITMRRVLLLVPKMAEQNFNKQTSFI
jgi:hypothetical protein